MAADIPDPDEWTPEEARDEPDLEDVAGFLIVVYGGFYKLGAPIVGSKLRAPGVWKLPHELVLSGFGECNYTFFWDMS